MTPQEINRLIDLYMEGKTSPEEERQLAIEVNRPDAPAEWQIIAEMLGELTLGEALYDLTMAERKRVRIRRYIGWSIAAVAACLALWFVLGKLGIPTLQQETAPQFAQQPAPVVKPEVPEEKEVPTVQAPASPAVEQVAYNAPTKRIKIRRYVGWGVAVAACLTLWFVLGKLVPETPQQDTTPQIAQRPTVVKPEEKKETPVLTPAASAVEQVAYTAPAKRMKRKPRRQAIPVMAATVETEMVPELPQVSEEELAQVEKDYQMWQLKQAILMEKIEMDAATMALNKKYEAYLEEYHNCIEI